MSLNNIELGDLIVTELYRDNLLATDNPPVIKRAPAAKPPAASAPLATPPATPVTTAPSAAADPDAGAPVNTAAPVNTGASVSTAAPETKSFAPAGPETNTPSASASAHPASSISTASTAPPASTGYKFLGNNRRKITVLVKSPGVAFLPDDQLSFLTRMLEACKMNVGDVAIVNEANAPVNITALKQQLQPAVILLFGMEPTEIRLPMNFPLFKLQAYDACTYLCAPSLEDLVKPGDESKLLKSKLWMCLKTLFEI